jgi:putative flippase GtrA
MEKVHHLLRRTILQVIDFFYPLFKRVLSLQTFRYAACGGVNTFLDIATFFVGYNYVLRKQAVVTKWFTISPHIGALILGMSISIPVGFYLNRYVVFQQSGLKSRSQLHRYLLVVFTCILLNYIFLKLFVDYFGWYPTLSKILTTLIVIVFSYTSQTFYFFKAKA